MNSQEVENLETVERHHFVERREALERLEKNKDFQLVITQGYFVDKAVEGVSMLAQEGVKRQGQRPDVMEMLVAISNLEDYFATVKAMGAGAKQDLDELEDMEEE